MQIGQRFIFLNVRPADAQSTDDAKLLLFVSRLFKVKMPHVQLLFNSQCPSTSLRALLFDIDALLNYYECEICFSKFLF